LKDGTLLITGRLVFAVAVFTFTRQDKLYIKIGVFFMSTLRTVTTAEFEEQVLQCDRPVVVDFGAPWCPPCRAIAPILEDLSAEFAGQLTIVSVNTDDAPDLAQRYQIAGLPTMVVFRQGMEIQRVRGAAPKRVLKQAFETVLQR
jgi:thioredoxin 1